MEWKSNTGQIKVFPRIMGTPWDFQEPFCFYPWEPGSGLCIPQSPTENPEAAQRNAKCQWSDCASTFRETERWRYKAWPPCVQSHCYEGQKWNCTHTAKGVHLHELQKIITGWPRSLNSEPGRRNRMCEKCLRTSKINRESCKNKSKTEKHEEATASIY